MKKKVLYRYESFAMIILSSERTNLNEEVKMNNSSFLTVSNKSLLEKTMRETLKGNEKFLKERNFISGFTKKIMRNKLTGVIYEVSFTHDGYLFTPQGNSTRKPFYKTFEQVCEKYEDAGTGLN